MIYYHNPRCTKSREGLALLQEKGIAPEIRLYMEDPLTPDEMEDLVDVLDIEPSSLLRRDEKVWKEEYRDLELTEDEILLLLIEHPQLMQRPILVNGNKAAVGRPVELLLEAI